MRTKEAGRNAKPVLSLLGSHSLPGWCAGMEKRRPPSIKKDDAKQCCLLPIALPPLIEKSPGAVTPGLFQHSRTSKKDFTDRGTAYPLKHSAISAIGER